MKTFRHKVAAISGAASGIGRALAVELANMGCHLTLSDIDPAGLRQTALECERLGVTVETQLVDMGNRDDVALWASNSIEKFGKIHLLFNNAGVALISPVTTLNLDDMEWLMRVNFWGMAHGVHYFLPHLIASGEAHIINLSSILGIVSSPTQAAYSASKFAVRGFTESLRMEMELMQLPVGVTCIHLGGVATNIVNSSRIDSKIREFSGRDVDSHRRSGNATINVTTPESAAASIIQAVNSNARRSVIGPDAKIMYAISTIFGSFYQKFMLWRYRKN
ncbi:MULTISPECIES: SDR family NAD(P)-dependent oxidoreductase [Pandoraea]|uniref:SDR family NAD(P)-dependent oxidoreductase n=1 Tax=Pandoraea TaxID=93217 RepID=UPI001F5D3797|nr:MULTISPECIES: SDR family NAD(P)-dependent oxidoreductase [Pandoraea]MCI3208084.1 short-chain dehydrogenase [Pandoraea sp. LA3]MDN4586113.1 short-chain dehydrogenase [Pandoraea capi]